MDSSNNFRSIFLIIISTALGAFFGVTIKDLFSELNVTTIGFYRFFFGLILISPLIIKNIVDIAENYQRKGVMIFSSTVKHAKEIISFLPDGDACIILGDTEQGDRDNIINEFKEKKFKYLVNVSVLTTGFEGIAFLCLMS